MNVFNIRISAIVLTVYSCGLVSAMNGHDVHSASAKERHCGELIMVKPSVGSEQRQTMVVLHGSAFDLEAFLKKPEVLLMKKVYPVSLSDELKQKLINADTREQFSVKVRNRLKEISERSYSSHPIFKIAGYNLFLSNDGEKVYSAATKAW